MDDERFDRLARVVGDGLPTRRQAARLLAAAALGGLGRAALGGADADAKRRRRRKRRGNNDSRPRDRCPGPVGICDAPPSVCGSTAEGEECGCERSVEGNNVCVNSGAGCPTPLLECTSTGGPEATSCRNLAGAGFHFFCQEAKRNAAGRFCGCGFGTATGRVCMPECDNPTP